MKKELLVLTVVTIFACSMVPLNAVQPSSGGVKLYTGPVKLFEPRGKPDWAGNPGGPNGGGEEDEQPENPDIPKWAVIIGISDYRGRINDLNYCDDDARDMYDYLISRDYPAGNIKLLLDKKATAQAILDAIDWMEEWELAGSECVFYYSGHGYRYTDDERIDDDDEGIDEGIVSTDLWLILDGQLRDRFAGYESTKIALIFDTCFSGGMDDLTGDEWENPTVDGRVLVAACGENEYSYDGTPDESNGVFTYYYIEGLNIHDTVEEAFVDAAPLAKHRVAVLTETEGNNPEMYDNYWTDSDNVALWKFLLLSA